jgi:hypothetical protein
MLTKILMPNLSFGCCMYVCMYGLYAHKLLCQNEFWLLCTLTSSKWGFAHDIVCFGCCMQPKFLCPNEFWVLYATKFLCPNEFWVLYATKVLMSKWVLGVVCNQFLMSKWVLGVVCNQSSYVQMSLGCCLPQQALIMCKRNYYPSTLAASTLNIFYFQKWWIYIFLKEQKIWWR